MTDGPVREYADILLVETREEVSRADSKASMLLAAGGVIISVVAGGLLADGWKPSDLTSGWWQALWFLGFALVLLGLVSLGAAVYPRVKVGYFFFSSRRSHKSSREPRDHPHYFAELADHPTVESARRAIEAVAPDITSRTVEQAWQLSHVAMRKFGFTKAALWLYGVGGLCLVVAHIAG